MVRMKIISTCLVVLYLFFSISFGTIFAQESTPSAKVTGGQIDEAIQKIVPIRFLPSHPLYFLITVKESITRFFKPSAAERFEFDFILSSKRLKETHSLLNEGKVNKAYANLSRYTKRLGKMVEELKKARSQNQDIAGRLGRVSDGFKNHEILLASFLKYDQELGQNLETAIESFKNAVGAVDKINPGIKDRYKLLDGFDLKSREEIIMPSPTISPESSEATPSLRPRRIIY